jgi:hypothetical protein
VLEIDSHPEYRPFVRSRRSGYAEATAISPEGRWVATIVQGQVRLWDCFGGQEIGSLPDLGPWSVWIDPDGTNLITCGFTGLARWPIQFESRSDSDVIRLGPRQPIHPAGNTALVYGSSTPDGGRIAMAVANAGETRVIERQDLEKVVTLRTHPGARYVSISPNGKWVATGTWQGSGVKVWDAESGGLVQELPEPAHATVLFSPDGRWLVTAGVDYHIWDTGSWRAGPEISLSTKNPVVGVMAFSPDSQVLAVAHGGRIRLLEPATARTLADLEAPTLSRLMGFCFSRDGTRLIASDGLGQVHAWDLRRIRKRLAAMKLDWDLPAYAPQIAPASTRPVSIKVIRDGSGAGRVAGVALRDPGATAAQIDLTEHYNVALKQWVGGGGGGLDNSFATMPSGLQTYAGVMFDVRGIVRLAAVEAGELDYPARENRVGMGVTCHRLHFLHATAGSTKEGRVVGSYVLHYTNGAVVNVPIVYGHTTCDFWVKENERPLPRELALAWSGTNPEAAANNTSIRLVRWTWDNPLPNVEIRSLDFVSSLTGCPPFLVAITCEP